MRVLIELPTWLGDSVMSTPAIENLIKHFYNVEITLIGSHVSVEALKNHPNVFDSYVINKNIFGFYKFINFFDEFDLFVSFRSSLRSSIFKLFIPSKRKFQFDKKIFTKGHQVEKYNAFINKSLKTEFIPQKLVLHTLKSNLTKSNKLLGINPGASYGSAKQWYPSEFADVAQALSKNYDIVIFGGIQEKDIAYDIENCLIERGVKNYQNLAAKTSIEELINRISILDLFISGDSGPMHLAAAFQVPTVAIFGPTKENETSQWLNPKSAIVKENLECQPCMARVCPLNHHNCMKLIKASDVLKATKNLISF